MSMTLNIEQRAFVALHINDFLATMTCLNHRLDVANTKLAVVQDTKKKSACIMSTTRALKSQGVLPACRLFEIPHANDVYITNVNSTLATDIYHKIYAFFASYIQTDDIYLMANHTFLLDVSHVYYKHDHTLRQFAGRLKTEIQRKFSFNCHVGIGDSMFLSMQHLHDVMMQDNNCMDRDLDRLWGVSEETKTQLSLGGIETMDDLMAQNLETLIHILGEVKAPHIYTQLRGVDYVKIGNKYKVSNALITSSQILGTPYLNREMERLFCELMEDVLENRYIKDDAIYYTVQLSCTSTDVMRPQTYTTRTCVTHLDDVVNCVRQFVDTYTHDHTYFKDFKLSLIHENVARYSEEYHELAQRLHQLNIEHIAQRDNHQNNMAVS